MGMVTLEKSAYYKRRIKKPDSESCSATKPEDISPGLALL